jgi:carboxyl-terminal processing protease
MRKVLMIFGLIAMGAIIGYFGQPLISGDNIYKQVEKFNNVLSTASKNYVEEVDTQKLVEAAIKGMLNELDPHSVYISAEEMKKVNEDFQGSFDGIGVEFDILNDTLTIVTPIPNGPSEKLGILSGDKIIKIDGVSAIGIERNNVPKKLKGPKGTKVELDIKRFGVSDLLHYNITRDKIPLNTVDASFIVDGTNVGVVIVNRFAATTNDEVVEAMKNLKEKGMKNLILDLRGNPGGFLNQAFLMADQFVRNGDTVVFTKSRKSSLDEVYISNVMSEFKNIPIIVLINAGSASASEIVSGAIQDLDRGLVVGETSYGKGLVQRQYEVGDGSAYRLTISKYYTPSGRCIQRPYKNKDEYRHLVGRLELEEGNYLENPMDKIKQQVEKLNAKETKAEYKINVDSLPIFHTLSGRPVFAGGGITPDYIIKSDTITRLSVDIRRKNLFFEFTDNYLRDKGKKIKENYDGNFSKFYKNFQVNDEILRDFRRLAESKDIKWDEKLYETDKDYFQIAIKADLARALWGRNQFLQVFYTIDRQMNKAIELFPEAQRVAGMRSSKGINSGRK